MYSAVWVKTSKEAPFIAWDKSPKKLSVEVSPKKSHLDSVTRFSLASYVHTSWKNVLQPATVSFLSRTPWVPCRPFPILLQMLCQKKWRPQALSHTYCRGSDTPSARCHLLHKMIHTKPKAQHLAHNKYFILLKKKIKWQLANDNSIRN